MTLTLWDNAFSPFARKVRMVLEHKQIEHEVIDGLRRENHDALAAVNGRVEVPVIVHDDVVVAGSSDIVAYLERVFPARPVYPSDHASWVRARAWERCADTVIDPIVIDVSYWLWAERDDEIPAGLRDAARADLAVVYAALERALDGHEHVCGETLCIADIALFPHLSAVRALEVPFDGDRYPRLLAYYQRLRAIEPFAGDLARTKRYLSNPAGLDIERKRIFWRGERIEWILARGYHRWFVNEIEAGRVIWPGLAVPRP